MRVPDEVLQCVCFLCVKDRGRYHYGGTGFFASMPSEKYPEDSYVYIVTARHCIEKAKQYGNLYVRLNKLDGKAGFVEMKREWYYPDNESSDAVVLDWPPLRHIFKYKYLVRDMFVTDEVIKEQGIGVGDEIVMTGLFTQRYGNQRNIPIVRAGVISAMPDEALEDPNSGLEYHAYLAELRSIGGLSGSPVFVFLGPARAYQKKISMSMKIYLLGLVRGHWDIRRGEQPLDFTDDELQVVNMGIGLITPIQDVAKVLDSKELVKGRRQADEKQTKSKAPTKHTTPR